MHLELIRDKGSRKAREAGDFFRAASVHGVHYGLVVHPEPQYSVDTIAGSVLAYLYRGAYAASDPLDVVRCTLDDVISGRPILAPRTMWTSGWFAPVENDVGLVPEVLPSHPMSLGYFAKDEHGTQLGRTHEDDGTPVPGAVETISRVLLATPRGVMNVIARGLQP